MMKLSVVEFARLSGVDHATISRMIRDKRLLNNGGLNPDDLVSKAYLTGRFMKIRTDADVFCKVPMGWDAWFVVKDGNRLPWVMILDLERAGFKKIIHLRCFNYFALNDDSETVTENATGEIYELEAVAGGKK